MRTAGPDSDRVARIARRLVALLLLPAGIAATASCSNPPAAIAVAASSATATATATATTATATATPSVTYPNSVAATVDCGDDGVANVSVKFGLVADNVLIGRNPTTLGAGGQSSFSMKYGTSQGLGDATLVVSTAPTRGTCTTTLTDYDGGKVLAEQKSAGKVTLTAIVQES